MANALLKPTENVNIQNYSVEEKWKAKVNDTIKQISQQAYNAPIAITKDLAIDGGVVRDTSTGVTYLQALSDSLSNGFYIIASDVLPTINQLQSGQRMRLSQVNEIVLSYDLAFSVGNLGGFAPPAAAGDYTINLYISLVYTNQDFQFNQSDYFDYVSMFTYPVELSYNLTSDLWTITNPKGDFRFSDWVLDRANSSTTPDFTVDGDKITRADYINLVNQSNNLVAYFGYAADEYTALSAANKSHFDAYFNIDTGSGIVVLEPRLSLRLTYYGLTANYIPTNN